MKPVDLRHHLAPPAHGNGHPISVFKGRKKIAEYASIGEMANACRVAHTTAGTWVEKSEKSGSYHGLVFIRRKSV